MSGTAAGPTADARQAGTRSAASPGPCGWCTSSPTGPPEGLSLSDLARALGTSKSTTLALARTLTSFGDAAG